MTEYTIGTRTKLRYQKFQKNNVYFEPALNAHYEYLLSQFEKDNQSKGSILMAVCGSKFYDMINFQVAKIQTVVFVSVPYSSDQELRVALRKNSMKNDQSKFKEWIKIDTTYYPNLVASQLLMQK